MKTLIVIFFFKKADKITERTRLAKEQSRLDICRLDNYKVFALPDDHQYNAKLSDCLHASSVSMYMFKNRIEKYLMKAGYAYMRTLDKPMAEHCHLSCSLGGNLVKSTVANSSLASIVVFIAVAPYPRNRSGCCSRP